MDFPDKGRHKDDLELKRAVESELNFEPSINAAENRRGSEERLHPPGTVDPYFTGGVGYYRRTIQFTQPTVAPVDIFDPFFGFFFFPTLVPANLVLGNITLVVASAGIWALDSSSRLWAGRDSSQQQNISMPIREAFQGG